MGTRTRWMMDDKNGDSDTGEVRLPWKMINQKEADQNVVDEKGGEEVDSKGEAVHSKYVSAVQFKSFMSLYTRFK